MSAVRFQPLGHPVAGRPGIDRIGDIDPRLTRSNYFDGRLLTADDLTRDQTYLDQRLREVGRVLGHGVVRGLNLALDRFTGELRLSPGRALTPAGRVLELPPGDDLVVDLNDRALLSRLNHGKYSRLDRGLYGVVLRHVEVGTDRAEVFPRDLGGQRESQVAFHADAVQLGLIPLPAALPEQNPLAIRAWLMREFSDQGRVSALIPEDAVALGVLAIRDDVPQWLDAELLRHPVRSGLAPGALQADLMRQYEALLADLLLARSAAGMGADFQAADHFSLLPPVGSVPVAAVDPVSGRQGFFPENYQVFIAPVRAGDVPLIESESRRLPPIDLSSGEPVSVMILAPLSAVDYADHALQLERHHGADPRALSQIDPLRLALHPRRPVHALDTDASVWAAIHQRLEGGRLLYARRPVRAAETGLSAMVLALGASLPQPVVTPLPSDVIVTPLPAPGDDTAAAGGSLPERLMEDEDSVFLRRLGFARLTAARALTPEADRARARLLAGFSDDADTTRQVLGVLLLVDRHFDAVLWPTLLSLAEQGQLPEFGAALARADSRRAQAEAAIELGRRLNVPRALLEQWANLAS